MGYSQGCAFASNGVSQSTVVRGRKGSPSDGGRRTAAFALLCLAAVAAAVATSPAPARSLNFQLSTGHNLQLPDLNSFNNDCRHMDAVLAQIDRTGYRTGPRPHNPADMPLFNYEKALARMMYSCPQRRQMFNNFLSSSG